MAICQPPTKPSLQRWQANPQRLRCRSFTVLALWLKPQRQQTGAEKAALAAVPLHSAGEPLRSDASINETGTIMPRRRWQASAHSLNPPTDPGLLIYTPAPEHCFAREEGFSCTRPISDRSFCMANFKNRLAHTKKWLPLCPLLAAARMWAFRQLQGISARNHRPRARECARHR